MGDHSRKNQSIDLVFEKGMSAREFSSVRAIINLRPMCSDFGCYLTVPTIQTTKRKRQIVRDLAQNINLKRQIEKKIF